MNGEFWQAILAAELPAAKGRALLKALGPSRAPADLLAHPLLTDAERERMKRTGADLPKLFEKGPKLVEASTLTKTLPDAFWPPVLFVWGQADCLDQPTVGIVGTRGASTYGKAAAQKFAEALASSGVTVVSGGALGIDAAAHKGAMAVGGATVAVLANGIDRVYPAQHAGLFQQIRTTGCLVSMFAVNAMPNKHHFLMRNRLVAALSQAVIVIEAPERSGALSTASQASELGREVFVVPANIENTNFRGSHALIRDGATLVDHPGQVLEALDIKPKAVAPTDQTVLSANQSRIMAVLSTQPLAAEFIVDRTGLDTSEVLSELTLLEIEGRVIRDAGGYAVRV
jgi:DNA processing protein